MRLINLLHPHQTIGDACVPSFDQWYYSNPIRSLSLKPSFVIKHKAGSAAPSQYCRIISTELMVSALQ